MGPRVSCASTTRTRFLSPFSLREFPPSPLPLPPTYLYFCCLFHSYSCPFVPYGTSPSLFVGDGGRMAEDRRRTDDEQRTTTDDQRQTTDDDSNGRQTTDRRRRTTDDDGQMTTDDKRRRTTQDGRTTEDGRYRQRTTVDDYGRRHRRRRTPTDDEQNKTLPFWFKYCSSWAFVGSRAFFLPFFAF